MNRIIRFLIWLRDSLPLYSTRRLAVEWFRGQDEARRQIGVTRDQRGRFTKVSP